MSGQSGRKRPVTGDERDRAARDDSWAARLAFMHFEKMGTRVAPRK